jgi:endonuclease I
MRKSALFVLCWVLTSVGLAQIPPGYYDVAIGLSGDSLRTALHHIIKNHQSQSYASLWTHFQQTDKKITGEVWDIYSDIPGGTPAYTYTFVTNQCGNYSGEGDCYNREHSVPSSWFNNATPMYSDLFHLYPTDGFVNGKRSNYPFGEVSSPTWTSTNGSRLGPMSFPGYSGVVFEPIDAYKGDLARTYLYMAIRYQDVMTTWNSAMFSGDSLTTWARSMLLKWHAQDTVSQKEINRNDSIFKIQGNRNPLIDHPEWVSAIWDQTNAIATIPNPLEKVICWSYDYTLFVSNPESIHLQLLYYSTTGVLQFTAHITETETQLPLPIKPGLGILVLKTDKAVIVKKLMTI